MNLLKAINSNLYQEVLQLKKQVSNLVRDNMQLKKELENSKQNEQKSFQKATDYLKDTLRGKFSSAQVDSLITGKPVTRWKEEDISTAITLRSLSSKAYNFLRTKMIPLPSTTTINRWVSDMPVEPGILDSVLTMLKHQSETMTEAERLCTLSLDETSVQREWTYDKATDRIYEPKRHVMCVMIRGLIAPWKQLLYYDFDTNMTKDILFQIIQKVEAVGFLVTAMVNDLAPNNVRLWNALGISHNNTSFPNPAAPHRKIFVFADAPHLLKLIRNNLLDSGFKLDGDKIVSSDCLRELIGRSTRDLKTTHRLSSNHIDVHGVKRMNVRLAAQLLSETTAKSLKYFGEKNLLKCKTWQETSEFISLVDLWFDMFNSKKPTDIKQSRNAFGINFVEQTAILNKMKETARTMRVGARNSLLPFQKGLITSCTSLSELYKYLKEQYNLTYIMTARLNQDALEHFFGCLRQIGGTTHQHPSPVQVKYRIRSYLLGKHTDFFGCNSNIQTGTSDPSISESSLFETRKSQTGDQNLDEELTLSAMLFSAYNLSDDEEENDLYIDDIVPDTVTFETEMEKQGLLYFGGYIVKKFPNYSFLGEAVGENDTSWIGEICRQEGKLMKPSDYFFKKLEKMEACFNVYHGKTALKPGYNVVKNLSASICPIVDLAIDVVTFFVRCRTFFRIRELNRRIRNDKHKHAKKMDKIMH